jgi:hypothetical protein
MARMNDCQREIHDGMRREKWSPPKIIWNVIMDVRASKLCSYITIASLLLRQLASKSALTRA